MSAGTEETNKAAVYREAARNCERDFDADAGAGYAPYYAGRIADDYGVGYDYYRDPFLKIFGTKTYGNVGILALCMMAAMVEAGDA